MRLVLASGSAARAALLRDAGVAFEVRASRVDEAAAKAAGMDAAGLARMKAAAVEAPGAMVVGADQMLSCEGRWFDKPPDLAGARETLCALRGRPHELVTAVVCMQDGVETWRHVARPQMVMRAFSDAFLEAYLAVEGDAVLQSVGAYRLEGMGVQLFDRIDGEHSAVLGLPLLPLLGFLRQAGVLMR